MIRTQEIEIKQNVCLDDIKLEKNREIEIYSKTNFEYEPTQFIKIVNINGKLVIFAKDIKDIILKEWEGHIPYKKAIRDIEDEMEEVLE